MKKEMNKKYGNLNRVNSLRKFFEEGERKEKVFFHRELVSHVFDILSNLGMKVEPGDGREHDLLVDKKKIRVKADFRCLGVLGRATTNVFMQLPANNYVPDGYIYALFARDGAGNVIIPVLLSININEFQLLTEGREILTKEKNGRKISYVLVPWGAFPRGSYYCSNFYLFFVW